MIFNIYLKKYIPKVVFVSAFLMALFSNSVLAQKVTIEDIVQKDKKVYVYYTLEGNSVYEVNLYYVLGQESDLWKRAYNLSGDFGYNQKGSYMKLMVWDVLSEKDELVGKYDFKVTAFDTKTQKKKELNQKLKNAEKYAAENSIIYLYNELRPYGFSYAKLNKNGVGGYSDIAFGGEFPGTSYREINDGGYNNHPGNAYRTGIVKNGSLKLSAGITHKIRYPFWGYAGLAYQYNKVAEEVDSYWYDGEYDETAYYKNTDQESHKISLELGLQCKIDILSIRTGVIINDGLKAQLGVGLLF